MSPHTHIHLPIKSEMLTHNKNWIKNLDCPHLQLVQQDFTRVSTHAISFVELHRLQRLLKGQLVQPPA